MRGGVTRRGLAGLAGGMTAFAGGARAESPFEVAVAADVMVAMRDGVKLAAGDARRGL
jgi:predicted acyl esterase